jgi:formylmethanofuran dehydrogenase subunit E
MKENCAVMEKTVTEKELEAAVEDAVRLHGHLGPFLVIGVRMGKLAERTLKHNSNRDVKFQVTIRVPQTTPFSCTIDGIQSTTRCTIGNQKLKVEKSEEISGSFEVRSPKQELRISVKPKIIEDLLNRFKEGARGEQLAAHIASVPEEELFITDER